MRFHVWRSVEGAAMMLERQKALPLEAPQSCSAMSALDDTPSASAATFCTSKIKR